MKLLIDIPEHIYEHAKEMSEDSRDEGEAMRAIANGSPQEGCGDAISRQAVLDEIDRRFDLAKPFKQLIESMPSVTPQPKTGRWIQKEEEGEAEPFIIWECSECHCVDEDGKPSYKYCPQCGAKMEGEE